jgi:hypothetical protein
MVKMRKLSFLCLSMTLILGVLTQITAAHAATDYIVASTSELDTALDAASIKVYGLKSPGRISYTAQVTSQGVTTTVSVGPTSFDSTSWLVPISGLKGGSTYSLSVTAVTWTGGIPGDPVYLSGETSVTAQSIPGVPVSLSGVVGTGQVLLSWSAPVNKGGFGSLTGYQISGTGLLSPITVAGAATTTYTVTGLADGSYTFSVAAVNSLGRSTAVSFGAKTVTAASPTAPNTPPTSTPLVTKDPEQTSTISSITQGCPTDVNSVVLKGSFPATISNISINNRAIDKSSWKQSATQVVITLTNQSSANLEIQIFNGQVPVLATQTITIASACPTPTPAATPIAPTPTPTPTATNAAILKTLICIKGKSVKTIKGTNPRCPKGYVAKKK